MKRQNIHILAIVLFVLALTLPFSNKAYHVDDAAFIYVADQIAKDPLRPYSFVLEWGGHSGELATHLLDTPLVSYYIALVSWLFGRFEMVLHISFILFSLTAGISFYFIAKKFIRWPLAAALIMVATPTFLVSSHNLMLDVPMISLFLLSIALFVYGVDESSHKLLLLGSLTAGLAYLAKPNALFLIPLMAFYCFIKKKPKYMAYQLIPVMFIVLFAVHNYYFEDRILIKEYAPFLYGKKESSISIAAAYFFSNLSYIGGGTIFTLFLLYPFILRRKNISLLSISLLFAGVSSYFLYRLSSGFVSGQYTYFQIFLFFAFVSGSSFFILINLSENYGNFKSAVSAILSLRKAQYGADSLFIFAWFLGMLLLNSGISGGAARYNTLFLPPLILSYFSVLEKYKGKLGINSQKIALILAFTAITGILAAYADYEYADSYRDFAKKFPQQYKNEGNSIFFTGGSGFQYYMAEKGYRLLYQNDNSPKKGDYVIKARLPSPRAISSGLMQRLDFVKTISYDAGIPVRTQNPAAHAGFYTYGGGFLPVSFSNSKLENFDVYYVKR